MQNLQLQQQSLQGQQQDLSRQLEVAFNQLEDIAHMVGESATRLDTLALAHHVNWFNQLFSQHLVLLLARLDAAGVPQLPHGGGAGGGGGGGGDAPGGGARGGGR